MAKKRSKRPSPRKTPRKPREPARSKKRAAEAAFAKSLVAHGQAVKLPKDGKLPSGATHELVEDDRGEVKVVRRRFSSF
jgi:hypothetical protein